MISIYHGKREKSLIYGGEMKQLCLFLLLISIFTLSAIDNFAGNCLDFDGANDYVNCGNDSSLNVSNAFTFETWVYYYYGESYPRLFDRRNDLAFYISTQTSRLCFSGLVNGNYEDFAFPSTELSYDTWTHVALTYDGTDFKVYLNGNLVSSATYPGGLSSSTVNLYLGNKNTNQLNRAFEGKMDEVRWWNTVRTEQEISDYMNTTLEGDELGLVSYWQFNESSGNTASDAVGSNHGTLGNMSDEDWVASGATIIYMELTTAPVIDIDYYGAVSGGEILDEGVSSVSAYGVCWSSSPNPTLDDDFTVDGSGSGVFASTLSNLNYNTTYYYRAYATNSLRTCFGEEFSFTTRDLELATLTTTVVSNIDYYGAETGGDILDYGGTEVTAYGVCWSTVPNPTIADSHTTDGTGAGSFTSILSDLSHNTTYYYKAYATNSLGTSYGDELSFTTVDLQLPVVISNEPVSFGTHEAELGGEITDWGGTEIVAKGICWSTEENPTIDDNFTFEGTGTDSFISSISSLPMVTDFYYKAYATNSNGTAYGQQRQFTTTPSGMGTSGSPYLVSNYDVLKWISTHADFWDCEYLQTADIDASQSEFNQLSRIGRDNSSFSGVYDGDNYVINNLHMYNLPNGSMAESRGLFGYIYYAEIKNLGLSNIYIADSVNFGSLIGISSNSTISNCYTSGVMTNVASCSGLINVSMYSNVIDCRSSVSIFGASNLAGIMSSCMFTEIINCSFSGNIHINADHDWAILSRSAGIVRYVSNSLLNNCSNYGTIMGMVGAAGLSHSSESSIYNNCLNKGDISASGANSTAGGLIAYSTTDTLFNCYNQNQVSNSVIAGGLIGKSNGAYIENSYSSALTSGVTGSGALVGEEDLSDGNNTQVLNSFWNIDVMQVSSTAFGQGRSTIWMQTIDTYLNAGWDFEGESDNGTDDIWRMNCYGTGYPFLAWEDSTPYGSTPTPVSNMQVEINNMDAELTWDEVNSNTDGMLLIPDGYLVKYSENNQDFFFLNFCFSNEFTHQLVTEFSPQMFYEVTVVKNYTSRQLQYLQSLNNTRNKLKWQDVERTLRTMR